MSFKSKFKKRVITLVLLCIILLISLVSNGFLYEKVEKLKQEHENLSKKIENNSSSLPLSQKDIENLFNRNEVKNEN